MRLASLDLSNTTLVATTDQISTRLHEDTVILHNQSSTYFSLDTVGSTIWEQLQQPCSFQDVLNVIVDTYDVTKTQAETDLKELLQDMIAAGLVDVIP